MLAIATGCLSNQYEIGGPELARMAGRDAETGPRRVRVVQQTVWGAEELDDEPMLPAESASAEPHVLFVDVSHGHSAGHVHPRAAPARSGRVSADPTAPAPSGTRVPADPTPGKVARSGARTPSRAGADTKATSAEALTAAAAAVAVVSAAGLFIGAHVEGSRYDGWLELESDDLVLLVNEDGSRRWTEVGEISTEDVAGAERAVIVDHGSLRRLGRAPLDRVGLSYRLEVGLAQLSTASGRGSFGPQARAAFGGYPSQSLGLMLGGQFAAGDEGGQVFNGRGFFELAWLPITLGGFHAGAAGEVGLSTARQDTELGVVHHEGPHAALGALFEFEISTRLALTLRAEAAYLPGFGALGEQRHVWVPGAALGLAVY